MYPESDFLRSRKGVFSSRFEIVKNKILEEAQRCPLCRGLSTSCRCYDEKVKKLYAARAQIPKSYWGLEEFEEPPEKSLTIFSSSDQSERLAKISFGALYSGKTVMMLQFYDLVNVLRRERSEESIREEIDWVFMLDLLVIANIPLSLTNFTTEALSLKGYLDGRETFFPSVLEVRLPDEEIEREQLERFLLRYGEIEVQHDR